MLEPPRYLEYSPLRLVLYRLVTSKYFDLACSAVIGLNIITMAMEFYMMPEVSNRTLNEWKETPNIATNLNQSKLQLWQGMKEEFVKLWILVYYFF